MLKTIPAHTVTLAELETHFQLQRTEQAGFFEEWQANLPALTDWQKQLLDQVKAGYANLIQKAPLLEKPINLAVVSPLLFIGEFYLTLFDVKAEKSLEIVSEDQGILVKGNLDTLVLKDQLWVTIIESKQASFSVEAGLPQLLAYLLAAPEATHPNYGMITNGGSFLFVKLVRGANPQYAFSDLFGIQNQRNGLYEVFQILKHLVQLTATAG